MKREWIFILSCLSACSAVLYLPEDWKYQNLTPLFSLDKYEPCLAEKGGTYCMLQLTLYAEPGNEGMDTITEYSKHSIKHYNYTIIDRGVCVTKTCEKFISNSKKPEDLRDSLEECLNDSLQREFGLRGKVSTLYYCNQHNEPAHINAWDWTVLVVILGLVSINIVGSVYDSILSRRLNKKENSGNAFLISFSIKNNWKRLTKVDTSEPLTQDLHFIHGVRVISNLFTVFFHTMWSFTIGFSSNPHDIEKLYELPLYQLVFNGLMIVQLFFFISGFLTAYLLQNEEQRRTFGFWDVPKILLLRISRLMPGLAVVLALVTSWLRHAGSGPLWKFYVTGTLVADCRNCWWHHLFFINNYMQGGRFCLIQTWHLAADMQVFIVGMTAYVLTKRRRRIVLSVLLLLSALAPALHTILEDLDVFILTPQCFRTLLCRTMWSQHFLGHNNLPCFIIGMMTAERLYHWQINGQHSVKNRWYSVMQYLATAAVPLTLYSGRMFYAEEERPGLVVRAIYSSAVRILLGLACAFGAPAFFTKTPSYIKSLFEWRCWVVPSRLTYSVFLIHMVLINMMMGARTELCHYSFANLMEAFLFIVASSFLVAVPFCLMVEAPFTALFKNLAEKKLRNIPPVTLSMNGYSANGKEKEKKT